MLSNVVCVIFVSVLINVKLSPHISFIIMEALIEMLEDRESL